MLHQADKRVSGVELNVGVSMLKLQRRQTKQREDPRRSIAPKRQQMFGRARVVLSSKLALDKLSCQKSEAWHNVERSQSE